MMPKLIETQMYVDKIGHFIRNCKNVFSTSHEANCFKEMKKVFDVAQARVCSKTGSCVVVRNEEEVSIDERERLIVLTKVVT